MSEGGDPACWLDRVCDACGRLVEVGDTCPACGNGRGTMTDAIAGPVVEDVAMDDQEIARRIAALTDEEHALERAHVGEGLDDDEHARLRAVEVELDQCWDLLRQRRARRSAGKDPDEATARPETTVEGYLQ